MSAVRSRLTPHNFFILGKISLSAKAIAEDLLNLDAVKFNVNVPFMWASGIKSPVYCDNRRLISDVAVRNRVVNAFVDLIKQDFSNADIIAGVATGGIPLGMLVADRMNLPFIYVRQAPKEHGLMKQVEGYYEPGNKVVLIEDLISTGGSSIKAVQGLKNEKLEVLCLISIMTYGFESAMWLFKNENIEQYSLCDLDALLEVLGEKNLITKEDKESIRRFRIAPNNWG